MSFDKTAIEEANKHLLAMNKRVIELGALLNEKTVRLESIEAEHQSRIEALIRQKDAEIEKRNAWLESTQAEIRRLKVEMSQQDGEMTQLRLKASILDRITRYKPELVGLLDCLNEIESPSGPQTIAIEGSACADASPILSDSNDKSIDVKVNGRQSISSEEEVVAHADDEAVKPRSIVWTPKARPVQQADDSHNTAGNNQAVITPSKTPGGAVKDLSRTGETKQTRSHHSDSNDLEVGNMGLETQL